VSIMSSRTLRLPAIIVTLLVTVIVIGCTFESPGSGELYANVPYHQQENYYYCGAAVVQMIAEWSGAHFTQDQLFIAMNGTVGAGITVEQIAQGLQTFTSLFDAYIDYARYDDNNYWARQISSVTNKTPVAAMTDANTHSVVVYGGSYRTVTSTNNQNTYYWNDVYVHDPGRGGGINYTAGPWQSQNCQYLGVYCIQCISHSAALAGPRTLADYNPTVVVYGGDDGGSGHGPYDY
jgi:hypothetical protein